MAKLSDIFLHLLGGTLEGASGITPKVKADLDLRKSVEARENLKTLSGINENYNAHDPGFVGPLIQGSLRPDPNTLTSLGVQPGTTFEPIPRTTVTPSLNPKTNTVTYSSRPLARGETLEKPSNYLGSYRLGEQRDQFDERRWERLGNAVNALTAGSRKALGVAATANMRSDRALETLSDPKATPQDLFNVVADIQGIYKGGSPDEMSLKYGQYKNLWADLANIGTYLSGSPQPAEVPKVQQRLKQVVTSLKAVDNKVIDDNLGINKIIFRPLIKNDPNRWQDLVTAINQSTVGVSQTPLLGGGSAPAAPQLGGPGAGGGGSGQAGTIRFRDSQGGMHDIPASNLDAAKLRDPGLKVIQ